MLPYPVDYAVGCGLNGGMGMGVRGAGELRNSLHVVKTAQPGCTGICQIVAGLGRHAEAHGWKVRVLFLGDGPLAEAMRAAGLETAVVPWSGSVAYVTGAWRVGQWLRRNPAEIVHLHHGGTTARMLARAAGARVVGHLHGLPYAAEEALARRQRFGGADAMIACAQAVAASFPRAHAEVVYNGVDVTDAEPAPRALEGRLQLGMLGRLIPLKNANVAIEAVARLAATGVDVEMEIAGDGECEAELRGLVKALGVEERVRFLGWRGDVGALLKSWDALLIPSRTEGLPLAVLEAMAAGRAVVASRVGGLVELVDDGVTGVLMEPGNRDALESAIAGLASDRERLARMGIAGWRRARAEFTRELMARRTFALYDRLLLG